MCSPEDGSRLTHVILHLHRVQSIPRVGTVRRGCSRAAPSCASPCHPGPRSVCREGSGSSGFLGGGGVALSILLADLAPEVSTPNSPPRSSTRFCTCSLSWKPNY